MDNKNTLQQFKKEIKIWWEAHEPEFFLIAVVVLVSSIIFGAWRFLLIESYEVHPRKIVIEENAFSISPKPGLGQARFVASVNGAKYYPAACKAANRIKEENRLWFTSEQEAREMGYAPSAQC